MLLGRQSSFIHFVSNRSCSSPLLSSVVFRAIFSETRIPTPPPLLFVLCFSIHLYPLIEIWSPFFIFVSVMRAMSIFSAWRSDSRLFIFPFSPLTLIVASVISRFFLILFLFFLFVSRFFPGCLVCSLLLAFSFGSVLFLLGVSSVFSLFVSFHMGLLRSVWAWTLSVGAGCQLFLFPVAFFVGCTLAGWVDCALAGWVDCPLAGG